MNSATARRVMLASLVTLMGGGVFGGLPSAEAQAVRMEDIVLRPGDLLRIAVWRRPEFSCECVISADGTVGFPPFRGIVAVGRPLSEVSRDLFLFLEEFETEPAFVIDPMVRIAVGGEVRSPNLHLVGPQTTLAEALVLSGGPTERGDLQRVRLLRDGQESILDLRSFEVVGAIGIQSGDHILVSRQRAIFRDYVMPGLGLLGSVASLLTIFRVF